MSALVQFGVMFPGQGSQTVGMGRQLRDRFPEAARVFDAADEALGQSLSSWCFEGPAERLKQTEVTQPAVLATSVAVWEVFRTRFKVAPIVFAGHSLGEYSALVASGALAVSDAVRLVSQRGQFMQEAVPAGLGAMAAVLGLDAEKVAEVCTQQSGGDVAAVANYNEPGQTVIAGHTAAVERASAALKAAGAKRVLPLPVSAPFHCQLMAPVQPRLRAVLASVPLQPPQVAPVIANVTAEPHAVDADQIRSRLVEQVVAPVQWVRCVRTMRSMGTTTLIELGPGKVLTGLAKRIDDSIKTISVEDADSLEAALRALEGVER